MAGEIANSIYTMIEFFVKDPVAQLVLAAFVIVFSTISVIFRALKVDLESLLRFGSISRKTEAINKHIADLSDDKDTVIIDALKEKRRILAFQETNSGISVRAEIREQLAELREFDWSIDWKDFKKAMSYLVVSENKVDFKITWIDWIMVLFSFGMGAMFI